MHILLILFVFVCVILVYTIKSKKEFYGGPVKGIRKIPLNNCYEYCDKWGDLCEKDRPMNDGGCNLQVRNCKGECYYSNYQRL